MAGSVNSMLMLTFPAHYFGQRNVEGAARALFALEPYAATERSYETFHDVQPQASAGCLLSYDVLGAEKLGKDLLLRLLGNAHAGIFDGEEHLTVPVLDGNGNGAVKRRVFYGIAYQIS